MTTLEKIKLMKSQGYNDRDIINTLQQDGVPPREINEAIAQSKIKAAIAGQGEFSQSQAESNSFRGMESSLMTQPEQEQGTAQETNDYPSEQYPEQQMQYSEQAQYPQEENIYPESFGQAYPPQYSQAYPQYESTSNETITEIAEQIIDEKLQKTANVLKNLTESKILLSARIDKIDERLQRVESIIDNLQSSLIRGATSQSQNIEDIKKEMNMMQDSFSKIVNPLVDRAREIHTRRKASGKKTKRKTVKKKS